MSELSEHRISEETWFRVFSPKDDDQANVSVSFQDGVYWLSNLFVHPDHRGKGYATEILSRAVSRFADTTLYLKVQPYRDRPVPSETLLTFYQRFGFEPTDVPMVLRRTPAPFDGVSTKSDKGHFGFALQKDT